MSFSYRAAEFLDGIDEASSAPDCGDHFRLSASAATLLDRILQRSEIGAVHDDEEVTTYTLPTDHLRQLILEGKRKLPSFRRQEFMIIS